jgi:hypothetical protein
MQPQVFDKTHPLKEVLVWGELGIEALLGQLLPKSKSLFLVITKYWTREFSDTCEV